MRNFKKTVSACTGLVLTIALIFVLITAPYFFGTAYYYQDGARRDSMAGSLDLLVTGSSHACRGIAPDTLDRELGCESYILTAPLQTMRGRYFLLRKELDRNPVKTVVMEVSYNALTRDRALEGPEGDIYQLGKFSGPADIISYFFFTIRPSEYGEVYHDTIARGITAWKMLLKREMKPYTGRGYISTGSTDLSLTKSELNEIYQAEPTITEQDADDVYYFEKCLDICRENNVRLILAVTPISDRYILMNTDLDTVRSWYLAYAEEYDCEFYDFNLLKTRQADYPADTAFSDKTHLSRTGAETFTGQLAEVMKMTAAGESTSDLFYNDYGTVTEQILRRITEQN